MQQLLAHEPLLPTRILNFSAATPYNH